MNEKLNYTLSVHYFIKLNLNGAKMWNICLWIVVDYKYKGTHGSMLDIMLYMSKCTVNNVRLWLNEATIVREMEVIGLGDYYLLGLFMSGKTEKLLCPQIAVFAFGQCESGTGRINTGWGNARDIPSSYFLFRSQQHRCMRTCAQCRALVRRSAKLLTEIHPFGWAHLQPMHQ